MGKNDFEDSASTNADEYRLSNGDRCYNESCEIAEQQKIVLQYGSYLCRQPIRNTLASVEVGLRLVNRCRFVLENCGMRVINAEFLGRGNEAVYELARSG